MHLHSFSPARLQGPIRLHETGGVGRRQRQEACSRACLDHQPRAELCCNENDMCRIQLAMKLCLSLFMRLLAVLDDYTTTQQLELLDRPLRIEEKRKLGSGYCGIPALIAIRLPVLRKRFQTGSSHYADLRDTAIARAKTSILGRNCAVPHSFCARDRLISLSPANHLQRANTSPREVALTRRYARFCRIRCDGSQSVLADGQPSKNP
jgi:hypothetical protein